MKGALGQIKRFILNNDIQFLEKPDPASKVIPRNARLENVPTEPEGDESEAEDGAGELARPVVSIALEVSLALSFFFLLDFGVFISRISGGQVYDQEAPRTDSRDPDNRHTRHSIGLPFLD